MSGLIQASHLRARLASAGRTAAAAAIALPLAFVPAPAQAQSVSVVRDAEIEALMRDYARPILGAAGLSNSGIQIVLVNNPSFNAFVLGRRIFFHTGALMQAQTPNEIIGVLAHEAGHIAGGHQDRLRDQLARAQTIAIAGMLLGVGAAAAGAGQVGMGIAAGSPELARRSLLSYQRSEETTADRSAITYLERTGQSAAGMLRTFERLAGSLALSGVRVDPYQISHPMPRERIANLETLARRSAHFNRKDPPELQARHDMMRAKIAAFTQGPAAVQQLFRDNRGGIGEAYGDAIVTYLHGSQQAALAKADALIKRQPRNPYFHELRADILIKMNRAADGARAYERAVSLDPHKSGVLRTGYGQALLATGTDRAVKEAITQLNAGLQTDPEYVNGYRFLAQAYGRTGDIGLAELATAEGHFHAGQYREAKIFAARAQQRMRQGSPPWMRAQDIVNFQIPGRR